MVRQEQLILLLFYYRLHVSTYIQVIFRPFDRIDDVYIGRNV
jgi:hypothetical protein